MTVSEPMTLFTDWLLAAVVFVFALRLARTGRDRALRFWATAFFAAALAAATGGAWHGFRDHLGPVAGPLLWQLTLNLLGVASFCLLAAAAWGVLYGRPRRFLIGLAAAKLIFYAVWMAGHDAFMLVIIDYGSAMLLVLLLQVPGLWRKEPRAVWIAAGIFVSFAAAGVQAARLAPHPHFNHNDLYHIIQIGAFYLLYRGGKLLRDRDDVMDVKDVRRET